MGDPLYPDGDRWERLAADPRVARLLLRVQWLKLGSGLIALAIIAAIAIVWRWGAMS